MQWKLYLAIKQRDPEITAATPKVTDNAEPLQTPATCDLTDGDLEAMIEAAGRAIDFEDELMALAEDAHGL